MDNTTNVLYPWDDKLNYALSQGFKLVDVPQNLVLSYGYELPFGKGRSGTAGHLLAGWSVNGIATFQAGQPLMITVGSNQRNNNSGFNLANITCSSVSMPKTVQQWFDTGCFTAPPQYTFGNSGVGHVRGPRIQNWDFSIAKDTKLGERPKLRIEASFFNIFITLSSRTRIRLKATRISAPSARTGFHHA